jgi:hypothetical protein
MLSILKKQRFLVFRGVRDGVRADWRELKLRSSREFGVEKVFQLGRKKFGKVHEEAFNQFEALNQLEGTNGSFQY